eukprot:13733138-Alexandrium_andersonii.AAC.1
MTKPFDPTANDAMQHTPWRCNCAQPLARLHISTTLQHLRTHARARANYLQTRRSTSAGKTLNTHTTVDGNSRAHKCPLPAQQVHAARGFRTVHPNR